MFILRGNQQQQQQQHQQSPTQKRRTNSSSSIIGQIIGQVAAKTPTGVGRRGRNVGNNNNNNKQRDSLPSRLIDQSAKFKERLDQLQLADIKSDLKKSLSNLVQATTKSNNNNKSGGATAAEHKNNVGRRSLSRKRSSDGKGGTVTRPLADQHKSPPPIGSTNKSTGVRAAAAGCRILTERNGWSTKSMQPQRRPREIADKARRLLGADDSAQVHWAKSDGEFRRASSMVGDLFAVSKTRISRRASANSRRRTKTTVPLLFISASFSQLLLMVALILVVMARDHVQMAPIWPYPTGQTVGSLDDNLPPVVLAENKLGDLMIGLPDPALGLVGIKLDEDIADELSDRLKLIGNSDSELKRAQNDIGSRMEKTKPEEFLWIERRRLNRDRALEPPAWLRARPIRGDRQQQQQVVADEPDDQQLVRPMRRRSVRAASRQLRDSNGAGLYDELMDQVVGGALDTRTFLQGLFDELETRARARDGLNKARSQQSPESASGQLNSLETGSNLASVRDFKQDPAPQHATVVDNDQAEQLIVAGDEVSDSDDVTLLAPQVAPTSDDATNQRDRLQPTFVLLNSQQNPAGGQSAKSKQMDEFVRSVVPAASEQSDRSLKPYGAIERTTSVLATEPNSGQLGGGGGPLDVEREGGFIELIPITASQANNPQQQLLQQLQQQQPAAAAALEESFHVLEDIDQVDNNQEVPTLLTVLSANDNSRDQMTGPKANQLSSFEKRATGQQQQQQAEQTVNKQVVPFWTRRSFGRGESTAAAAGTSQGSDLLTVLAGQRQELASAPNDRIATAIKLVRAGYFTRKQLLEIATELKFYLERALNLPRGSIKGLFPANKRQILVELEPSRLGQQDRFNLAQEFGYSDGSSSFTLDWASRQQLDGGNPLPILAAILDEINADDQDEGQSEADSLTTNSKKSLALLDRDAGGLQINELGRRPLGLRPFDEVAAGERLLETETGDNLVQAGGEDENEADQDEENGAGELSSVDNGDELDLAREYSNDWRRLPVAVQTHRPRLMLSPSASQPTPTQLYWLAAAPQPQRPQSYANWLAPAPWGQGAMAPQQMGPFAAGYPLASSAPVWPYEPSQPQRQRKGQAAAAALTNYLSAIYGINPWPMGRQFQSNQLDQVDNVVGNNNDDDDDDNDDNDELSGLSDEQLSLLAERLANLRAQLRAASSQHVAAAAAVTLTPTAILAGNQSTLSSRFHYGKLLAALGLSSTRVQSSNVVASFWLPLGVILVAFALTVLLVKLIMRRLDKAMGSSRRLSNLSSFSCSTLSSKARLWSPFASAPSKHQSESGAKQQEEGACATIRGDHQSGAPRGQDLQRAPPASALHKRGLSTDSGLETTTDNGAPLLAAAGGNGRGSTEKLCKNFDLLAVRLARFMNFKPSHNDEPERGELVSSNVSPAACEANGSDELESSPLVVTSSDSQDDNEQQHFRSSTSYIRSLIEALTRAANVQTTSRSDEHCVGSGVGVGNDDDEDDEDDESIEENNRQGAGEQADDFDEATRPTRSSFDKRGRRKRTKSCSQQQQQQPARNLFVEDQDEVLMSQMDISAAHLILDYMEKHLVDKEMLRREWLELNASGVASTSNSSCPQHKAQQLMLQRLARVALQETNLSKNRNLSVVPFDRNRVRLGRPKQQIGVELAETTTTTASGKTSAARRQQQQRSNSNPVPGDYINASFIYDDDPRKPTHIIAQGPTGETCGQFWQMIWEQEVSLIVMLTRLNENGAEMCHCYWPTSVASTATNNDNQNQAAVKRPNGNCGGGSGNNSPGRMAATSSSSPPPPANGRRGSVTSVFSGSAGSLGKPIPQPIVAGAELDDNVLAFELPSASITNTKASRGDHDPTPPPPLRLEVQLISEHVSSGDYLVRNMYLINRTTNETRTISQFHYLAWLESGTPDNVRSFLQFRRKVHKSYRNSNSPILVHCSDGAGRSGTYALVDMILERIKNGAKEIDLRATLEHLRDQRPGLCASQGQFEFALVALAEEIQIILNALPQ